MRKEGGEERKFRLGWRGDVENVINEYAGQNLQRR